MFIYKYVLFLNLMMKSSKCYWWFMLKWVNVFMFVIFVLLVIIVFVMKFCVVKCVRWKVFGLI